VAESGEANVRSGTRGLFGSRGCGLRGIDGVTALICLRRGPTMRIPRSAHPGQPVCLEDEEG